MPVEPPPSGSGGGSGEPAVSPESWVNTECPGFCAFWHCPWIYLNIPAMKYFVPLDPVGVDFPYSGWVLMKQGAIPEDMQTGIKCGGKAWTAELVTIGDPEFNQTGERRMKIVVCCFDQNLSHPTVHFNFTDSLREIGQPDPAIAICIRNLCLTEVYCRCVDSPYPNLPGYNNGIVYSPKFFAESICSDITINDSTALTSLEVRCLCTGICDCEGIPTELPVLLQCYNDGTSSWETIGEGSMTFVESTVDIPFPHWDGQVVTETDPACTFRVGILCSSNPPETYDFFIGGSILGGETCEEILNAIECGPPNCPVWFGRCDPFGFVQYFSSWIPHCAGTFRWVVGNPGL